MAISLFRSLLVALCACALVSVRAQSPVISEIGAATSQQTLQKDSGGSLRMGSGAAWHEAGYDASWWPVGVGTWGYGSATLGTNVQSAVKGRTATFYLRREYEVTMEQALSTLPLSLSIDYNDACVVYVNGREAVRRNCGPSGTFVFVTQNAYNIHAAGTPEVITLGATNTWLTTGTNIIAIQVLNKTMDDVAMTMAATLATEGSVEFFSAANPTSWLPGLCEPSGGVTDRSDWSAAMASPLAPSPEFLDWIELHNPAVTAVDIGGWTLSDDPAQPAKWTFPAGSSIAAGGQFVVAASGRNITTPPFGGLLHTSFKLDDTGETVVLSSPSGMVSQMAYPRQGSHHSYGLSPMDGALRYLENATPSLANTGAVFIAAPEPPVHDKESGHYANPFTVALTAPTAGSVIRYTTNGSEPTATSPIYSAPFDPTGPTGAATRWACLRTRAFLADALPSDIVTRTYLINYDARLRTLASLCLNADPVTTYFGPNSLMSIVGGSYTGTGPFGLTNVWKPTNPVRDYNIAMQYGKAWEKPTEIEIINALPGVAPIRSSAGIRISGSVAVRPYYVFPSREATRWDGHFLGKPSFNVHFRDDYGGGQFDGAIFPPSPIANHSSFRLRAGHNDYLNPFYKDELMRRLFYDMGHAALLGRLTNLYINGHHKGYYNLIERGREDFLREWYKNNSGYDVITPFTDDAPDGDKVVHDATLSFLRTSNFSVLANYKSAATKIDLDNYLDYILLNAWGATGDWPTNNFIAYRERTAPPDLGPWRFFTWDAEGAMGDFGHSVNFNIFTSDLRNGSPQLITTAIYRYLWPSPEFKLKAADRVQRLFFNNGAMTQANIQQRHFSLRDEMNPTLRAVRGVPVDESFFNNWWPTRRGILFTQLRSEGFWPTTTGPVFAPHSSSVATGSVVNLTNPNTTGILYLTTNGEDPRLSGGTLNPNAQIAASVTISQPTLLQARVLNGAEWSPLEAATYATTPPPLVVSELYYNPPGADELGEFIELLNTGSTTVDLGGLHFTEGLDFNFTGGTLASGARLVLVKDATVFAAAFPAVTIAGVYSGSLNNGGEKLELRDIADGIVFSFTYADTFGDGDGRSLVQPPNAAWRPSALLGGNPGTDDSIAFTGIAADDTDHDGYSALMEYALGTSNTDAAAIPAITITIFPDGSATATAPWIMPADAVDLVAETSASLSAWATLPTPAFTVPASGSTGVLTWHLPADVSPPVRFFIRLRAIHVAP